MALKFRRGTTAQKSGSLAFGEPFVNTDLQTLQIGLDAGDVELVSKDDFNTFTSSVDSGAQTVRINQLAAATASINEFTASQLTKDSTLATVTSSLLIETANLETFTASALLRLVNIESTTASINSLNTAQNGRLTNLESTTSSINSLNTTQTSRLDQLSTFTASNGNTSLNSYTASNDTTNTTQNSRLTNIETFTGSAISRLDQLSTDSGSQNTRITVLENKATTLQTYTASVEGRFSTLATYTGSNDTTNTTQNSRLDQLSTFTASNGNTSLNSYTSSNDSKWSTLGTLSGSFARTNSTNIFNGNQTITGSLFISQDLIVQGSSSIQNISSSTLVIGTNLITLNTFNPGARFAGISVIDSGSSPITSGSFLYDSVQDEFVFVHRGNGINSTSSVVLMGPETIDNLGNEIYLTNNRLPKGGGREHLNDSNINDDGTTVSVNSNTRITGSLIVTNGVIGSINATNGVVSGSAQITPLLPTGVVSGSSQVNFTQLAGISANIISASTDSSTVDFTINGGSITANLIGGVVSGSSQVVGILTSLNSYTASNDTTNNTQNSRLSQLETDSGSQNTRISVLETKATTLASVTSSLLIETANLETFSASALIRLSNIETTTSSLATTYEGRASGAKTLFSGSSQVNYTQLSGISANIISASADSSTVDFTITGGSITANLIGGVVSGSSQITAASTTGFATAVKTQLDTNTVVSGSGQINVASTTGDIALGTRTSGNYVATITAGTGVSSTGATTGEGIAHTISIGQAVATSDNVRFNSLGIGMAATGTAGRIDASGDIVAFSTSDRNFKENITPIENPLDKIRKISGNTYDWKEELKDVHGFEGNDVGVIAQEIEEVLPQLVTTRENGYKAVKYDKLVALLIEGIKEQQLQIEQLRIDLDNCRNNKGL